MAGRWGLDIANLIQAGGIQNIVHNLTNYNQYDYQLGLNQPSSVLVSKAFLLDMCPFMCLCLALSFIVDKHKKAIKVIAPWAIFGGAITLFGGVLFSELPPHLSLGEYIFVGQTSPNNRLYFIMHFYLFVFGIIGLVSAKRFSINDFLYSCLYASLYLIYVKIMVIYTHCEWNATGMVANDWYRGEYRAVYEVLQLSFPAIQGVSYFGVFLVIVIMILLKSWICFDPAKKINVINPIYIKMFPIIYVWATKTNMRWYLWKAKLKRRFSRPSANDTQPISPELIMEINEQTN